MSVSSMRAFAPCCAGPIGAAPRSSYSANDQLLALTPRELHVLRQLLRNAGRVVTKSQLTETLAALNEDIGDKTIEVYIHRIRNKIHGHGAEIVTVRGFGYLLRQSPVVRQAEAT
jgi:DNA-binding response OmpR family regulator